MNDKDEQTIAKQKVQEGVKQKEQKERKKMVVERVRGRGR